MSALSLFREPTRVLLGDISDVAGELNYADAAIDKGLRTTVTFGGINRSGSTFTTDGTNVTPDVTRPEDILLLCAKTAKMFVQAEPSRKSLGLRGFRQSVGDYKELVRQLDRIIYDLESGGGISSFRSFSMWLSDVDPGFAEWWERWTGGENLVG